MKKEKKSGGLGRRIGKIALIVLCSLLAFVLLVLAGAHLLTPLIFPDFYGDAEKEYAIPGLSDGIVPQGYTYLPEQKLYLMCGYMSDGASASRIYLTPDGDEKNSRYIELVTADGAPYLGHTGGIATDGTHLFLANDGEGEDNRVWVMDLDKVLSLKDGESIKLETSFVSESRAAYAYVEDGYLWIGEFYRAGDYETKESHTIIVGNGKENHALICAYPLDTTADIGIGATIPEKMISVPDQVQGFVRTEDGRFILSTSFGLSKSHLLIYKNALELPSVTLTLEGTEIPVYILNDDVLLQDLACPPMSEELVIRDGRLYVMLESASKKYIFGNFIRGRHVYSLPIEAN